MTRIGSHASHERWRTTKLGCSELYLHDVHPDQETCIRDVGEKILPTLSG